MRLLSSGHQAIAFENLALRRHLAAFRRKHKRPILTDWDRLFWIGLSCVWAGWKALWSWFSRKRYSGGNEIGFGVTGLYCRDRMIDHEGGQRWPRSPPADCSDRQRESVVTRAKNPWGAENAGDCSFGVHPYPACCAPHHGHRHKPGEPF
jgi:hypothetical protein